AICSLHTKATLGRSMTTLPDNSMAGVHVYLVGIGGAGMSGLARIYHQRGAKVSGSDSTASSTTRSLRAFVENIGFEQDGSQISDNIDLLIYSAAIGEEHPERVRASALGIRQLKYA